MRSALLVTDMQQGIVERLDPDGAVLVHCAAVTDAARGAGVPAPSHFARGARRPTRTLPRSGRRASASATP